MTTDTFTSQSRILIPLAESLKSQGLIHLVTEEAESRSLRTLRIGNRELLNFTSCGYLGLESDQRLRMGAAQAIEKYGVHFDCSRAYISLHLYEELETRLRRIFEQPVAVTTSVTSAHLSCIPVLIGQNDAVILDQQVHASVQLSVKTVQADGTYVETIRHNRLDYLENRVKKLSLQYQKIWYMIDGVYSMSGDVAPMEEICTLMDKYEQLHLYVDDAHGMSWAGPRGAGAALSKVKFHPRMILVTSLGKSFGASGGVAVFPDENTKNLVRTFGKTLIFTSPLTIPVLGAAIASADIHLSEDIIALQTNLKEKMKFFQNRALELSLPLTSKGETPVCFFQVGKPELAAFLCQQLISQGILTNPAVFPSVPVTRSGVRVLLAVHHSIEDIDKLLSTFSQIFRELKTNFENELVRIV